MNTDDDTGWEAEGPTPRMLRYVQSGKTFELYPRCLMIVVMMLLYRLSAEQVHDNQSLRFASCLVSSKWRRPSASLGAEKRRRIPGELEKVWE